ECERLQAIFDTQCCASRLRGPAQVLAEAVVHFPQTLAEVTLGAGAGGRIGLRSHLEEGSGEWGWGNRDREGSAGVGADCPFAEPGKAMVTELWLAPDEFQEVAVVPGSRITFCLKEFRVSVTVTLCPTSQGHLGPAKPLSPQGLLSFAEASSLPLTIHYDEPGRPAIFTLDDPLMEAHLVLATLLDPESDSQPPPATNGRISYPPAPSDDFTDDLESYMVALESSACEGEAGATPSPTFSPHTPHPAESDPMEEEDGAVPGTPPHKKFRSLFFGSVLTSGGPGPAPSQEVLAEDSDAEC
ncbi:RAD9A protein, partial [Odontophorus gujanensis]|nr:RAD9A protein [Odontophorus gujanensis]